MGEFTTLMARDGHQFQAYLAAPKGAPRGAIVVVQEIFGVNHHIRSVTDDYAARGYVAIAPALFDRVRRRVALGYDEIPAGRDIMGSLDRDAIVRDIAAAVAAVRSAGRVGAVGYCWGGALADLAACQCDIAAAVSYYGRHTATWLDLQPQCPVMYHFGRLDPLIPADMVAAIQAGRPAGIFHVYDAAGHGFNCDARPEYHAPSAALARERTLAFLQLHLG